MVIDANVSHAFDLILRENEIRSDVMKPTPRQSSAE
jgi:hypothetical protein